MSPNLRAALAAHAETDHADFQANCRHLPRSFLENDDELYGDRQADVNSAARPGEHPRSGFPGLQGISEAGQRSSVQERSPGTLPLVQKGGNAR